MRKLQPLEKIKGSGHLTFSLMETITPGDDNHLLPGPVYRSRYFGICSLLSSVMSAHTLRLETGHLNSLLSWVKGQAIDSALIRACFHAGEIRVLDPSLCTKLSCIGGSAMIPGSLVQ